MRSAWSTSCRRPPARRANGSRTLEEQRDAWLHRLGNLMLLSRRKNTSLGNLDFANKRVRYFDDRVESLPNLQRLPALGTFALTDLEARHKDFLERLGRSYEAKP